MDSTKISTFLIVTVALIVSVYFGFAAATAQTELALWIGAALGITLCLLLGRNVWVLIPITAVCEGSLNVLPGAPPLWVFSGVAVTGIYLFRVLLKNEGFRWRWNVLDIAVTIHIVWILVTWYRNPVGVLMFGEQGGAKSYLYHLAAVVTYGCLSVTRPTEAGIKIAGIMRIITGIFDGLILLMQGLFASIAEIGMKTYVSPVFSETLLGKQLDLSESRLMGGKFLGYSLLTPAFTLIRPIRCFLPTNLLAFLAVTLGSTMILLSGFRSGIAYFVVLFILASLVRRKPMDAVVCCGLGFVMLSMVIASGMVDKMPYGVQRALIPFGVKVRSEAVIADAEKSSEDRFEMWRFVLTQKGHIDNKLLGDGFGMSRDQLNALIDAQLGFKEMTFIDRSLATGNYHGFHVAVIKYSGAIGLIVAIFVMSAALGLSIKIIKTYRNDQLLPYVLYFTLPIILYLPWALLVYAEYKTEFPKFIVMAGMVKLLWNMRADESIRVVENPKSISNRSAVAQAGRHNRPKLMKLS